MDLRTTVDIVSFTEVDFDRLIGWLPTSALLFQWCGHSFQYPLDREQLQRYISDARKEPIALHVYKAVDKNSGEPVGHGELRIDMRNQSALLMHILVGPQAQRGQGIGVQIVHRLAQIAFDDLKLHRVALTVFDFNTAAIRCYEKAGFKHEGVLRESRLHGAEYWNLCLMAMLEQEWRDNKTSAQG